MIFCFTLQGRLHFCLDWLGLCCCYYFVYLCLRCSLAKIQSLSVRSISSKSTYFLVSRQGIAAVLLGLFLVVFAGMLVHEYKHSSYGPADHEHVPGSNDCSESESHCIVCHLIFLHYLSPAAFFWSALLVVGCPLLYRSWYKELAILTLISYFSRRGPPPLSSLI